MCDHDCAGCVEPCDEPDETVIMGLSGRARKGREVDEDDFEMGESIMYGLFG